MAVAVAAMVEASRTCDLESGAGSMIITLDLTIPAAGAVAGARVQLGVRTRRSREILGNYSVSVSVATSNSGASVVRCGFECKYAMCGACTI